MHVKVTRASGSLVIDPSEMENLVIPDELTSKLRASYYFMSSLLAKYKHVRISYPGGCKIGSRPIDQTIKVFESLGATVKEEEFLFTISADELVGSEITLDMPSVGATVNALIVASRAKGTTILNNAAREPEIVDLANMLNKMGAKITGAGTSTIKIVGVETMDGCFHNVIPDRIEAGTYVILGALTGNKLKVDNIIPEHIDALLSKLEEAGVQLEVGADYVLVQKQDKYTATSIKTAVYPGFATDLQQPLTPLLTRCNGNSVLEETIYENRFQNVPYLNQMGANIVINDRRITVKGKTLLTGDAVQATDLRAGACLVLAGLLADRKTEVINIEHVLRGYENLVQKLVDVGADITLKDE
jgi:UDP-N-acetylglucosamine 1-carboxyvinyltransferase